METGPEVLCNADCINCDFFFYPFHKNIKRPLSLNVQDIKIKSVISFCFSEAFEKIKALIDKDTTKHFWLERFAGIIFFLWPEQFVFYTYDLVKWKSGCNSIEGTLLLSRRPTTKTLLFMKYV